MYIFISHDQSSKQVFLGPTNKPTVTISNYREVRKLQFCDVNALANKFLQHLKLDRKDKLEEKLYSLRTEPSTQALLLFR